MRSVPLLGHITNILITYLNEVPYKIIIRNSVIKNVPESFRVYRGRFYDKAYSKSGIRAAGEK